MTRAAVQRGIGFKVVLTIPNGSRALERKLKGWKSHRRVLAHYRKKQRQQVKT